MRSLVILGLAAIGAATQTAESAVFLQSTAQASQLTITPQEPGTMVFELANDSGFATQPIIAANIAVSLVNSAGQPAEGIVVAGAGLVDDGFFAGATPRVLTRSDATLITLGAAPLGPFPTLSANGVAPLLSLEFLAADAAAGSYSLLLLPFNPVEPVSSGYLTGTAPPTAQPFENAPSTDNPPGSLLLTVLVVPEPTTTVLALVAFLAATTSRHSRVTRLVQSPRCSNSRARFQG